MEGGSESLSELFEAAVKEETKEPELDICLEIADRMNSSKNECKEGVKELSKVLRSGKPPYIHNGVLLLESLVKNCNMRFHYAVSSKEFMETLLRLLKRVRLHRDSFDVQKRGKTGFFDTMYKNSALWDEIEEKVLAMIQLWADTFMMHEDEFREMMEAYRLLRKEGIKFPARDKNEKFMIQFEGTTSPIFEYLENMPDIAGNQQPQMNFSKKSREVAGDLPRRRGKPYSQQKDDDERAREDRERERRRKAQKSKEGDDEENEEEDNNEGREYTINEQEVEMIMGALSVLEEIRENADTYTELKSEVALEIINDCKMCYKRLNKMSKGNRLNQRHLAKALELQDSILEGLGLYKSKADYLKNIQFYEKDGPPKGGRLNTEPEQPKGKKKPVEVRSKSPKERPTETKEHKRKEIIDLLNDDDEIFGGKPTPKEGETPGEVEKKGDTLKTLQDIFSKDFYTNMIATKGTDKGKSAFAGFETEQKPVQPALGAWPNSNPFAQSGQSAQIMPGMTQMGHFVPSQYPNAGFVQPYAFGYPQMGGMPQMVAGVGYGPFVGGPTPLQVGYPQQPFVPVQGPPMNVTVQTGGKRTEAPNGGKSESKEGNDDFFADLANRNVKATATEH